MSTDLRVVSEPKAHRSALICAPMMPEFDRQSGQRRGWHFIENLRDAGWAVTFVAQYGSLQDRYARLLQQSGVATYAAPTSEQVSKLVSRSQFDLALLLYWKAAEVYLPIIRALSPTTRVIVDSVDLHFVRNARRNLRRNPDQVAPLLGPEFGAEVARELNVYAAADAALTVSHNEAGLINDLVMDPNFAQAVPDADDFERSRIPRDERGGILCLSNFAWDPNVEAFAYLCQEVLPRLNPSILAAQQVQVVGNGLDERIYSYANGLDNVRMVGWVPSVVPYLAHARISVIPLLHGAGTKRKLIQALMVGTPSVTTSIGAEGLNVRDGEHVLIADSPTEFAAAIERLLADADLWESLAENGRRLIVGEHSRDEAQKRFMDVISGVMTARASPVHSGLALRMSGG
jgi:glycosyltransferase involved in cell wall biosynthesis